MARLIVLLLLIGGGIAAYILSRDYIRRHPQDVPWTALRLDDPVGRFTLRKLILLGDSSAQCRALLTQAGAGDAVAPPRRAEPDCGYDDAIRLQAAQGEARFGPPGIVASCPVAAAMLVFERQVLQPAAARHFASQVLQVRHAGSYSCRRLYGRSEGAFSEHATANAINIVGFKLADGSDVSVLRDWGAGTKGAFLAEVHRGACRLFATALSPDYNAAHADHLHFDQAGRGAGGFSVCR